MRSLRTPSCTFHPELPGLPVHESTVCKGRSSTAHIPYALRPSGRSHEALQHSRASEPALVVYVESILLVVESSGHGEVVERVARASSGSAAAGARASPCITGRGPRRAQPRSGAKENWKGGPRRPDGGTLRHFPGRGGPLQRMSYVGKHGRRSVRRQRTISTRRTHAFSEKTLWRCH
jgi:hypothetical protein